MNDPSSAGEVVSERSQRGSSLRLDSDQELMDAAALFGWSGNGSRTSPFIIADYVMNGSSGGSGIYLGNTTLHAEIRNCTLLRTSFVIKNYGEGAGITLYGVSNVSINGCNTSTNLIGFHIIASRNVSVEGSDISWNYMYGIQVTASDNIYIESSNVEYNDFGIYVTDSSNVTVSGSHCHDNDDHGVRLDNSHNCIVWNSTFEHNDDGVNLGAGSSLNNVSLNVMMDCRESAIAIGEAENNRFHDNVMTDCSFYFPLEPLTVRFNLISRSNRVNGKDVQFIWNVNTNVHQNYDLSEIGQLIMVSSSRFSLSNMSTNGGSQAIVVKDCSRLFLENMTISNQLFHAIIMHNSPMISLTNCTISNCYNGLVASFSQELTMIDVIIKRTVSPLLLTSMDQLSIDRCKLMDNELGISLNMVKNCYISELTSRECGNADFLSFDSIVSFKGCDFISKRTILDLKYSSISSYASYFEMISNSPIISAKRGSVTLRNNTFKAAGVIMEPTFHPFKGISETSFSLEGNDLQNFGLLPDQVLPISERPFAIGTGNKVNGRPLLYMEGLDLDGKVISDPYGQIFLKDVSNLIIMNQSFIGSCVGVATRGVANITISDSDFTECTWGISVLQSINVNIRSSTFSSNNYGIHFREEPYSNNAVEGSFFYSNKIGCILDNGQSVKIRNNTFLQNKGTGVKVTSGSYNVIYDNLIMDNLGPGVMVDGGQGWNLIYRNAFIRNNGSGTEFSISKLQGYDRVTNHWSREGVGNFWYDRTGPDTDGDLIIDDPYPLFGGKGSDPTPMARIPASVLPPPEDIRWLAEDRTLLFEWNVSGDGALPITGFRLYLDRTLLWEGNHLSRETRLKIDDLPNGSLSMTSLSEFGEGEPSQPLPTRLETVPPMVLWKNNGRTELSSVRDSLKVSVLDLSGIRDVECRVDGFTFNSGDDLEGDIFIVPLIGLREGDHSVNITALDLFWNSASLSFDIIIDDSPPDLKIELPGNVSIYYSETLDVNYQVTDLIGTVDRTEMRLDGENVKLDGITGTVTLQDLNEGEHLLELLGSDRAGNSASRSFVFEIDMTPPRVLSYHPQGASVGYETYIGIELSEPLVREISLTLNGMILTFETSGNTIYTSLLDLQPSTDYNVRIYGRDRARNSISFQWMFTTGPFPSTPARLMGRIVDIDGRPLKDAAIWVDGDLITSASPDGRFEMTIPVGNHSLMIERNGFRKRTLELTLEEGHVIDIGDIALERSDSEEGKERVQWSLILAGLVMLAIMVFAVVASVLRNRGGGKPEE